MPVDYCAMAIYRLEKSRRIIQDQRERIAKQRSDGHPTAESEKVLATFERTHAIFERGLIAIVKEQQN